MNHLRPCIALIVALSAPACSDSSSPAAQLAAPQSVVIDCLAAVADPEISAAQAAARAVVDKPNSADAASQASAAWVAVGHAFVKSARTRAKPELYRNADACAERALAAQPNEPSALQLRGVVLLNDHRFADARALANALLARDNDDVFALSLLSDASLELHEMPAAVAAAQRMLDLKPSLLSYGRAAHLRFLSGDAKGAIDLYGQAIEAGKHYKDREPSAWMIVQAALVFLEQGDYAGAQAGLDLALKEVAGYAPALDTKRRLARARAEGTTSDRGQAPSELAQRERSL